MATSLEYSFFAKLLHWLMAVLVGALLILGPLMTSEGMKLETKFFLYQLHKSLGITVLLLTLVRLIWRLTHPVPALPDHMKQWEKVLARCTHWGFYILLLIIPLSGWIRVSVATFSVPTLLYGLIPWPHIGPLDALSLDEKKNLEPVVMATHYYLAMLTAGLLVLHIAGALKHHFADQDDVLVRIWFTKSRTSVQVISLIAFFVAFCCPVHPVSAGTWRPLSEKSRITFETVANKQMVSGHFKRFGGTIEFDPANPSALVLRFEIDTGSATIGNLQVDQALRAAAWFDVTAFPKASYFSEKVSQKADGSFEMFGQLTIKDKTTPFTVPFVLTVNGEQAHATGAFSVNRSEFGIGINVPPNIVRVDEAVTVRFEIWAEKGD